MTILTKLIELVLVPIVTKLCVTFLTKYYNDAEFKKLCDDAGSKLKAAETPEEKQNALNALHDLIART